MHFRLSALVLAFSSALLLSGCGGGDGGEDFAIPVKRPPADVYAPLADASDVHEAKILFPNIEIDKTRPSDTEILYTIPGTGDFPSTIRFQLEPKDDGRTTVIHAFVHVPAVRATIDGVPKQVSERKVEAALQSLLKSTAGELEMGSGADNNKRQLTEFLTGIAIATNKEFLDKALDLKNNPQKLAGVLMAFAGQGEIEPQLASQRDTPMTDPDGIDRQHEIDQARADWQQREANEDAAKPASDVEHYNN